MFKLKTIAVAAAVLMSGSAFAGVTGNAGAFSSYMFRGVDQAGAAAVQGGIDAASASGLYAGTWVSTLAGGNYETDLYAGYTAGGFDIGYIFYGYRDTPQANMSEVYAGYSANGLSAKLYFTPEYGATDGEAFYATVSYAIPLSDTLSLTPQVGYSSGDGIEKTFVTFDNYMDYSVTLAKTLDAGFSFSFGIVGNSEEDTLGKQQLVVGLKKSFDL